MTDHMALTGPGSRKSGCPRTGRDGAAPGAKERLAYELERVHALPFQASPHDATYREREISGEARRYGGGQAFAPSFGAIKAPPEIMALYGPGSRIDGYPRHGRNMPAPGSKERLEAGLERLHRLWRDMVARYVDLLDAETEDADLEPTLGSVGGTAGSLWTPYNERTFRLVDPSQERWADGGDSGEREDVSEDEGAACEDEGAEHDGREPEDDSEPDVDGEPSLGSLCGCSHAGDQRRWSDGCDRDLEEEHDGREPEHKGLPGDELDCIVEVAA